MTLRCLSIFSLAVAFAVPRASANFLYGDFHGDCVDYLMVSEANSNEPELYSGSFETMGDTLLVNPSDFRAEVVQGPGADFLDSQLEMMMMANPADNYLRAIYLDEFGDYFLAGDAIVLASMNWFLNIPGAGTTGGTVQFSDSHEGSGVVTSTWALSLSVDLVAGTANGEPLLDLATGEPLVLPDDINKVTFEFDNSLFASVADDLGSALIAKKATNGIRLDVDTDCVPEPGELPYGLVGWLALVAWRRRVNSRR